MTLPPQSKFEKILNPDQYQTADNEDGLEESSWITKMRPHAIAQLTPGPNNLQHKNSMILDDTNRELKPQSELGMLVLKKQTKSEYVKNQGQHQPKESTIVEDNTAIDTHRRLLS